MDGEVVLLFDIDATLIRTHGAGMRAMERAFQEVMGWDDLLSRVSPAGMTDPAIADALSRTYRGYAMTPEEKEKVFATYLDYLQQEVDASRDMEVLPGIRAFLEEASQDSQLLLGLGTGNLEAGAKIKLSRAELNHYFVFGGFGSDALLRPEVLAAAVKKAEVLLERSIAPQEVLVIGDTPHDIRAGKAIGAHTVAVATGPFTVEQLAAFQPTLVLRDFSHADEVKALIHRMKSNSA